MGHQAVLWRFAQAAQWTCRAAEKSTWIRKALGQAHQAVQKATLAGPQAVVTLEVLVAAAVRLLVELEVALPMAAAAVILKMTMDLLPITVPMAAMAVQVLILDMLLNQLLAVMVPVARLAEAAAVVVAYTVPALAAVVETLAAAW